jgi:hypothetical protein
MTVKTTPAKLGPLAFALLFAVSTCLVTALAEGTKQTLYDLYGVDNVHSQLYGLDRATGRAHLVGGLGYENVRGIAFDPKTGDLIGSDTVSDSLIRIDVRTARTSLWVKLRTSKDLFMGSIDVHPESGELFGLDHISSVLYRINLTDGTMTAAATLNLPPGAAGNIAFSPAGELYLADTKVDRLRKLTPSSNHWIEVGTMAPAGHVTDISFHPDGTLYGIDPSRLALVTISTADASLNLLPAHGVTYITSLANRMAR